MEVKIHFQETEIIEMLQTIGYTVESIKSWVSTPVYHNQVEYDDVYIWIAYKEKPTDLEGSSWSINQKYGIEKVFDENFKILLKYLFKKTYNNDNIKS